MSLISIESWVDAGDTGLAEDMQPWTTEYGTLWALETADGLPPLCQARMEPVFQEVDEGDMDNLVVAMNLGDATPIRKRLQGRRRCFCLMVAGDIASYGWVTYGLEYVGELERQFNLLDDEAYVWDCATIPAWRRQGLYSALLSRIIYQLHGEGTTRIWIGASRLNQPSIRGIANAGFQPVIDCTYRRLWRLTLLWMHQDHATADPLVPAAYRILVNEHERRLGRLIVGYKR